ncbi:dihydroorotase [Natrinema ejinorense]|uniref:Dihydroorotase n=1 Tax=Natrinema ejinorense TaxID=373386 RepID=A0A2A5QPV8_9EURY|nr:amidohydrolase family protein [Natrinema ejinorense]PCR88870.1 dihydroorotase [Natrinema ejinorense]
MTHDVTVTGGTIVTADDSLEATLLVDDGTITGFVDPDTAVEAERVVDAAGKHVLPGGVDPHVHMMDPGDTEREDFPTGTAAAAAGGITTVGEHHRTDPTVLTAEILTDKREYLSDRARVDFGLLAGGHPDNVDEIEGLEAAGTMAYKSFTCEVHGVPALLSDYMAEVFTEVERVGGISMIHPEDERLLNANEERIRESGRADGSIVPEWRSKEAEQLAVSTTLQIAKQTGVSLWFAHLTHPELVDQVNHAKAQGVDVYAETCPQYFYLTREDVERDAPYTMFTPPAREESDREEMWNRLANGEIDMVNADHAPSTKAQKAQGEDNVFDAPFGIPGVETVLPLLLNGASDGKVTLNRVAEVFATNPAKITDIYPRKGTLRVGSDADFVVVDMDREQTLRDEDVVAKCGWTPYDGLTVTGVPETTYVRGEPVVENGEIVGEPGYGSFVARP